MRIKMPLTVATALLAALSPLHTQAQKRPLDIYFLDTEGGQATLFVSPSGQSMLVDTGFPGNQGALPAEANAPGITRDADRIMAVLKLANVDVLDYVVITHFHADHAGNAAELAQRIPIRHFVGPWSVYGRNAGGTRRANFVLLADSRTRACDYCQARRPDSRRRPPMCKSFLQRAKVIKEPMARAPGPQRGAPIRCVAKPN